MSEATEGELGSEFGAEFGKHVRSLRRARGLTQEALADRSRLSPDTIRRLEHGSFSPSLSTLRKLGLGLNLSLTTLIEGFELGYVDQRRQLLDLLALATHDEVAAVTRVIRVMLDEFGARR
jgi:transcriptional regulator with XRE-family HTH domain